MFKEAWRFFHQTLLSANLEDGVRARRIFLFRTFSLTFMLISAVMGGLLSNSSFLWASLVFLVLYLLGRRWPGRLVSWGLVVACIVFSYQNPLDLSSYTYFTALGFVIALGMTGLLLGPRSMFGVALTVGGLFVLADTLTPGTTGLGPYVMMGYLVVAFMISLAFRQVQQSLDVVLATNAELAETRSTLQKEHDERLHMFQTSFDVTRHIAALTIEHQSPPALLEAVVEFIRATFNFYHVHVYLYHPPTQMLRMSEGSGRVGAALKRQGHQLRLGEGIVGTVASLKAPLIVSDVDNFANFVRNPLLPDTRSEMAVPLVLGSVLVGVLDIQNNVPHAFRRDDQALMEIIAGQLALAVNKLQEAETSRATIEQLEATNQRLRRRTWEEALARVQTFGYAYAQAELNPLTEPIPLRETSNPGGLTLPPAEPDMDQITLPIILRGQTLAVLGLERHRRKPWSDDEREIIRSVAEQIGLALDGARLFEDTQRNAWRDQAVNETTARLWSVPEVESVLKAAVEQLRNRLDAAEVTIHLGTEQELLNPSTESESLL